MSWLSGIAPSFALVVPLIAGVPGVPAPNAELRSRVPYAALEARAPSAALEGQVSADTAAVSAILDRLHQSASRADGESYFDLFAEDAVFIGTDPGERWTLSEFREYAQPYFERGQGWTYVPTERHVTVAEDGETAWFDEMLENEGLGTTRGTGVVVREDGRWKVAQYHLTIPVPNTLAGALVEMIRESRR